MGKEIFERSNSPAYDLAMYCLSENRLVEDVVTEYVKVHPEVDADTLRDDICDIMTVFQLED